MTVADKSTDATELGELSHEEAHTPQASTPTRRRSGWPAALRIWRARRSEIPESAAHQCMYGRHGYLPEGERCERIVPAFSGARYFGEVYCSLEHAVGAQGDRAI